MAEETRVSTSEPVVEIVEVQNPDGSITRKKISRRTVTTKRLVSNTSEREVEHTSESHSSTSSASASASATLITDNHTSSTTSTNSNTTNTATLEKQEHAYQKSEHVHVHVQHNQKNQGLKEPVLIIHGEKITGADQEENGKKSFKYKVFGEGTVQDHPWYKFLARFPLKTLPAAHVRPRPVKPILYAFAPGWKITRPGKEERDAEKDPSPTGSFDVDSLKWMAYLKFNNIDYDLQPALEPSMSPSGKLPFLALPNGSLVSADGFEAFVQEYGKPSAKLDIHEAAEAVAFSTLAESKIHAALVYTLWFEQSHFESTTRKHYYGHHKPLLATLLAYLEKSSVVQSMLLTRTQIDRELTFEEADTAMEALSVQLGDGEYFFNKEQPSSLDAIVFAYLHVILTLPKMQGAADSGRSSELARIVRKHPNLYAYSQKIWTKWFAE